jgi:hypothetical protein
MKLEKYLILIPYALLFGPLLVVGCASHIVRTIDTTPVAQSLSTIDRDFVLAEKAKTKLEVQKAAESGRKEVASAQQKLADVQAVADKVTAERDWWKDDSAKKDTQLIAKEQLIKKRDARISLLSLIIAGLVGSLAYLVIGAFSTVVIQFYPPAAPFFFLIHIGGTAAITALVWAALRYL